MPNDLDYFNLVASVIAGGLGAAIISILFEQRQKRREMAIQLVQAYLAKYDEIARAKAILLKRPPWNVTETNWILEMGDWLDFVSALCNERLADSKLLERLGMDKFIKYFYEHVAQVSEMLSFLENWDNMKRFAQRSR